MAQRSRRIEQTNSTRGIRPIPRVSVKDTVIDRLVEFIHSRALGPGDRLPTELELAEALGVGRSSLREGISALASSGLLVRRAGDGTYISSDIGAIIARPLKVRLLLTADMLREAFEARRVLEGELAFLAATRADAADIASIEKHLEVMRRRTTRPEESSQADFSFHMAIALAAKNQVLSEVITHLSGLVLKTHLTTTGRTGIRRRTLAMHEAIASAIRDRDPGRAKRLMQDHLDDSARQAARRVAQIERNAQKCSD